MPRVMCVHFPHWSLQRIRHERRDLRAKPLALTRVIAGKGSKVIACCDRASRYRVRSGMMVAEAVATLPALVCVEEDPDTDRHALVALAEWSQRYSPIVGLEDVIAPSCLLIDVTGGVDCFGGEEALLTKVEREFSRDGWVVSIAIADTIGAALAHASFLPSPFGRGAEGKGEPPNSPEKNTTLGASPSVAPSPPAPLPKGEGRGNLPIAALRLSPATLTLLAQLGIERIDQLTELPRDQVAERFGPEVGRRLDQFIGHAAEVITPIHSCEAATASWTFDDPIDRHEILVKVLDILLERLQAILEKRHVGTRLIECILEPDGLPAQSFECSLSRPARTANYLAPLLRLKLEQIRVDAPVRAMSVRAVALERFTDEQPNLFDAGEGAELAQLLDSLTTRLGKDAVSTVRFVADPQPELACRFDPTNLRLAPAEERQNLDTPLVSQRPLRLFARPLPIDLRGGEVPILPIHDTTRSESRRHKIERFHCAGVDYVVTNCHGPERIETGWWRGDDVQRDYYLVETTDGTRWWLFHRLGDGRWFLHGCFD